MPRIAAELFLDSLVLALLASGLGLGLAYGALRVLVALAPSGLPRLDEIGIDGTVVLFTLALSLAREPAFWFHPRLEIFGRAFGNRTARGRAFHERKPAAAPLAQFPGDRPSGAGAGPADQFRTDDPHLPRVDAVDPGFVAPSQLQTFQVDIPDTQVKEPERVARLQEEILHKIEAIPGVSSAGLSMSVPLDGNEWGDPLFANDRTYSPGDMPLHRFRFVAPGFFKTLGTPLLAGRDSPGVTSTISCPVAIVSEKVAREYWHDPSSALGKQIRGNTEGRLARDCRGCRQYPR